MTVTFAAPSGAPTSRATVWTPIGVLAVTGDDEVVTAVDFAADPPTAEPDADPAPGGMLGLAVHQLGAYFAGDLEDFEMVLAPAGTPFQQAVWRAVAEVPFGAVTTYGRLARQLGRPRAARAVGHANGRNPIPVIVPCHRVIGSSGLLHGYGLGGLDVKRQLLDLESGAERLSGAN